MLERLDSTSAERWGRDLDAIKGVGFNTVKTWVDWATAEPRPGEFHFENLELLLRLAQARGLRVIVQVYLDSAPDWVGESFPDAKFVDRSGAVIKSQSAPGFCIDHRRRAREIVKFLHALARDANRSNGALRMGCMERAARDQLGGISVPQNPEFCFCRFESGAVSRMAESKIQDDRRAKRRVVSRIRALGSSGAAAVVHHSLLHGLSRLAHLH